MQPAEADLALDVEANRQTFITGTNKGKFPQTAIATIISKSEKKVTFVDLALAVPVLPQDVLRCPRGFRQDPVYVGAADTQWPFLVLRCARTDAEDHQDRVSDCQADGDAPSAVEQQPHLRSAPKNGKLHIWDMGGYTKGRLA